VNILYIDRVLDRGMGRALPNFRMGGENGDAHRVTVMDSETNKCRNKLYPFSLAPYLLHSGLHDL